MHDPSASLDTNVEESLSMHASILSMLQPVYIVHCLASYAWSLDIEFKQLQCMYYDLKLRI